MRDPLKDLRKGHVSALMPRDIVCDRAIKYHHVPLSAYRRKPSRTRLELAQ
jgi:hypothetical protein